MGRFDTANVEALGQLSWSNDELARLRDQQEELVEIPIIPSSYAVTRNIMNAFREVVNNAENPRDTLVWYNRDINDEIARKRENLGLDTDKDLTEKEGVRLWFLQIAPENIRQKDKERRPQADVAGSLSSRIRRVTLCLRPL